ncbi:MAG: type II secretion system protein GspC [Desulfococcaceae bacterium]
MFGLRYAAAALNILFLTAAVYLGVTAFYKTVTARMETGETFRTGTATADRPTETAAQPLAHYAAIADRNLFKTGDASAPPKAEETKPEPPSAEPLQETQLRLKLWGTVTGDGDGDRTYAVIEEPRKREQNLFRIGDTLEGAKVKEILREQVILTVNGQDEVLRMAESPGASRSFAAYAPPETSPSTPFDGEGGGNSRRVNLSRAEMESAMDNVNSLMRQARIRPHFRNGKPDGLTLSRVRRDSIFTRLGLRSGDIITGVDGQSIQSVDDALKFYNSLKSASNLNLQIRRRGQTQTLQYAIE